MSLFQHSVLNKYLKEANQAEMKSAYKRLILFFQNPHIQQNIRESKEEQFQEGFLTSLFVEVLGYTINPIPDFNITTEFKNERGAKKADGAILKDGSAIAVIELKSTKTKDLESIRLQAFDYKANQSKCVYVITSNFEKVRFYINNAVDFEEFDLFKLKYEEFQLLWLCLAKENLLKGIPLAIKEASILKEENITKQIYIDYSLFKRDLHADLIKNNLELEIFSGKDEKEIKLLLFKKSQKLLDRFLFIFFGEDRGLLPPNSISQILTQWEQLTELDEYKPLYSRYQKYFNYLNKGWKGKKYEIFAYNGGLFAPDEILDSIIISDEVLQKHTKVLTAYDFETDVDVNILGHIFENSLNEIEEITAQIEGAEVDLKKSKRKKDGVFYTPKYITKYIVENTVGKLCEEKKTELGIEESEYLKSRKGRTTKKLKELDEKLAAYRNWLLTLTICDPACGSGAFLNQALDFLIREHHYVDELKAKLLDVPMIFTEVENSILENNIFGVDINEESVEIAKLSLWLRTAQKGRKLTTLSNNIKCGNSLIDNPEVAGEKAFKWHNEFPEVFKNGGFDVVIGNPPYVRPRNFSENQKTYIIQNYKSAENQFDLYHIFIEKSEILRKDKTGITSLILPNAFLANENSQFLRKYILNNCHIQQIVDCKQDVFKDASVEVLIYIFDCSSNISKYFELNNNFFKFKHNFQSINFLSNKNYNFTLTLNNEAIKVFQKIKNNSNQLSEYYNVMSGIKEYQTGKGKPPQIPEDKSERRFNSRFKKDGTFLKEIRGRHVQRYLLDWENEYVSYGKWLAEPRNPIYFSGKRLLIRQIPSKNSLIACYTNEDYVVDQSAYVVKSRDKKKNDKGILGILNSKLIFWFYRNENNEFDNLFPKIKAKEIKALPIIDENFNEIEELVSIIESKFLDLHNIESNFISLIQSKFEIGSPTHKLKNWQELLFKDFLKELKKAKVKLSLSDEAEWIQYFNEQKQKVQNLKSEIDKTDKQIDQMVYELYGLTEEEIKIIENS